MSYALRGSTAFVAGILGAGGLVLGCVTYFREHQASSRATEILSLPDISRAANGERAVVEGIISKDVPILAHGFVAYLERQHQKNTTPVIGGETQPLRIEAAHGIVEIGNSNYTFDPWIVRWGHQRIQIAPPKSLAGAIIAEGLMTGRSIVAIGRATRNGSFEADTIAAGLRNEYVETLRRQIEWPIAWPWLLLSPLLLAYAFWQARSILREP